MNLKFISPLGYNVDLAVTEHCSNVVIYMASNFRKYHSTGKSEE